MSEIKILYIPAEPYPTHQPFMGEVYSKEDSLFKTVFLMLTKEEYPRKVKWNKSTVYLLKKYPPNSFFRFLKTYFSLDLRYSFWIPHIVIKEKINIIQVRDLTWPLIIAVFLKPFGIKLVYQKSHPHEIAKTDPDRIKKSGTKFPKLFLTSKKVEYFLLHKILKYCDAIIPITHYMAINLNRDYGIPFDKMYPFGMGFNFDDDVKVQSSEKKIAQEEKHIKFVYIGALDKDREFEKFFEGLALYLKRAGQKRANITLDLIGGRESEIASLRKYAERLGIEKNIKFHGRIDRSKVYELLPQYHFGLSWFGSYLRFEDASPTKLMEYLAFGLPFLAPDTVLMHKDVQKATNAGIVTSLDPEEIADKLEECVEKYPILAKNAQQRGQQYILEHHNYQKMKPQLVDIYKKILGK